MSASEGSNAPERPPLESLMHRAPSTDVNTTTPPKKEMKLFDKAVALKRKEKHFK